MKSTLHTYIQYSDLIFGHLPPDNERTNKYKLLIEDHENAAFASFVDDYMSLVTIFDAIFEFLHTKYFLRCAFRPIYLASKKTHVFTDQLDFIGFTGSAEKLWPSIKYRKQIEKWLKPTNREELDAFLFLILFLQIFIFGKIKYILIMKKAYLEEQSIKLSANSKKTLVQN